MIAFPELQQVFDYIVNKKTCPAVEGFRSYIDSLPPKRLARQIVQDKSLVSVQDMRDALDRCNEKESFVGLVREIVGENDDRMLLTELDRRWKAGCRD